MKSSVFLSSGGADLFKYRNCNDLVFVLQVPYETLNKRFRAAQKNIDRETSHVTMVVAELEKTLSSCPAVDSVVSLLDGVVEKLSVLKRKVSALLPSLQFFSREQALLAL